MQDAITQTPANWKLTIDEAATSGIAGTTSRYPKSRRFSSNTEDGMWSECWKVIDKYSGWETMRQNQSRGTDAYEDEGEGVQEGQAIMHGPTEIDNIMDVPPTPGSGRSAYSEPAPQWNQPNILDEDMQGIYSGDIVADVEMGNADPIVESKWQEATTKPLNKDPKLNCEQFVTKSKSALPIQDGMEVSNSTIPDKSSVTYGTVTLSHDATEPVVGQAHFDDVPSSVFAQATELRGPNYNLAGFNTHFKVANSDPTLPQMSDDLPLEGFFLGGTPQALPLGSTISPGTRHANSSPSFPYTIQSIGETDTDITPTTKAELDLWQSNEVVAPPVIEQLQRDLGVHPEQIGLGVETEKAVAEVGKVETRSASNTGIASPKCLEGQPDGTTGKPLGTKLMQQEIGEKPVIGFHGSHSPKAVEPPARMSIKFPGSFHQRVLDETVAQGLDYEQQVLIMEGLRGVERTARLSEVAESIGAVEVDPVELIAPSALQPIPPCAPSPKTPARGRKRKGKTDGAAQDASKKPKPASQIIAYTNEQHLARGWKFQDRKHFEAMKSTEVREHIRSILAARRWWNGLPKANMITKIMEWQQEMLNLQAEQPGDESDATLAMDDASGGAEKLPCRPPSTGAQIVKTTSHPSTAVALPETPANQANNQGFVRTSSSAAQSDVKLFYDPNAAPRQTPLLQKLKGAKDDVTIVAEQVSDSDAMETAPSSPLEIKTRAKSVIPDADLGVQGATSHSSTPKNERHEKSVGPGEGNDRRRSLRSRTASVAPESYA